MILFNLQDFFHDSMRLSQPEQYGGLIVRHLLVGDLSQWIKPMRFGRRCMLCIDWSMTRKSGQTELEWLKLKRPCCPLLMTSDTSGTLHHCLLLPRTSHLFAGSTQKDASCQVDPILSSLGSLCCFSILVLPKSDSVTLTTAVDTLSNSATSSIAAGTSS